MSITETLTLSFNQAETGQQAEAAISAITRKDWITAYSTLDPDMRLILEEACSNLAGMYGINYDSDGIGQREAETRLDVLRDGYLRAISLLRDKKTETFIEIS